ncbi:MAG: HicB family protein [Christensenellaceae bacterium]|nr:HicB family protein [Christensenellaceae bacterium]
MKNIYPVVIYPKEENEKYHTVFIPDFDTATQGENLAECMDMARDVIGLLSLDLQTMPKESDFNEVCKDYTNCIVTLVDIDVVAYAKQHYNRPIKRTVTLPCRLFEQAIQEGINLSDFLQKALKKELKIKTI